ncbi:NAD(P)H-dependent flavin oxidoreductase [Microbacterium album]|uniref:Propionate 3-nitronate monooxygenase n=1 Tax=Microbacterium album TaxID=2053191 RepID=A0A917IE83_9MICO|nr:DUF561 domain-containing protein [Microbacterium album]GGH39902.1 oxidoreductase [Microbacterium album]
MANRLTRLLGIEHPLVLGPFGGLSSVALTAAVSNGGGLGSYGLYGYAPDRIRETAAGLRAATDRPFALNLWLPTGTERHPDADELARARAAMAGLFAEVGLPLPEPTDRYLPPFDEQVRAALEARPSVISFVYGVPPAAVVAAARERGITVIGTATTVDEAVALEAGGVDAVVASGAEAAGHRVSFLQPAEESLVGTFALVPQVADAVSVPVIAAGGIADRRGVAAAFALGAEGVQVGTAFLRTRASAATEAHRRAIDTTPAHGTVLTRAMSGRLARGAPNRATRAIEAAGAVAPFPAQNWLTGRFRAEAARRDLGELQSLWLGQAAPLARHDDAEAVLSELRRGLPT